MKFDRSGARSWLFFALLLLGQTSFSDEVAAACSARPSPHMARSIVAQGSQILGFLESSVIVFAELVCLQNCYLPDSLSTALVIYRGNVTGVSDMITTIVHASRVIRFKCALSDDESYFKYFGCRLLFTFCVDATLRSCDYSTSVTPEGTIRTHEILESEGILVLPLKLKEGVKMRNLNSRCLKLVDITQLKELPHLIVTRKAVLDSQSPKGGMKREANVTSMELRRTTGPKDTSMLLSSFVFADKFAQRIRSRPNPKIVQTVELPWRTTRAWS